MKDIAWIHLTRHRDNWWSFFNMVMDFGVP